jgi:hypothetical protein
LSYGREARSGSSFRVDSACIAANPASGRGWIAASVPPAATTSARPERIMSTAYAIASAPLEHALTGVCTPARAVSSRPTTAAGPLGMSIGMVIGSTRRAPRSFSVS